MASHAEIKLVEPIVWFDQPITVLHLKKPKGLTFLKLGDPRFEVMAADGSRYHVEKDDVTAAYVSQLLTTPDGRLVDGGDAILSLMSLEDILQIKDALFAFFTVARLAISVRSSISSSSTPASSDPPSAGS